MDGSARKARADEDAYVVYRGDEALRIGTARECSEALGVSEGSVKWMSTPAAHKRESARRDRIVAERVSCMSYSEIRACVARWLRYVVRDMSVYEIEPLSSMIGIERYDIRRIATDIIECGAPIRKGGDW